MGKLLNPAVQFGLLGELGEVFQGVAVQNPLSNQTLRVINGRDVQGNGVGLEPAQIQAVVVPTDLEKQRLLPNDLLITVRNQPVKAGLWTHPTEKAVAAQNLAVWRIRDPRRLDPAFAALYLNSSEGQRVLNQYVSISSKVTFLSLSSLRTITLPLPPLETQHQLVQLDQVIGQAEEATQKALEARRAFLQTLIHEALGG